AGRMMTPSSLFYQSSDTTSRIRQATIGNLGDVAPVGGGISEMRIHHGPGYRVYFLTQGKKAILLLLGGTKRSQKRDVTRARKLAEEY
ncbi:MAG: type II toxin-antitoxin system RelE/ParE family toxin, partial [Proteobacteria bacterium]|nr:type II toxin-antitoxin system RelE/ParE family toxin [Pseudomonadota bacterium]